MYTEGVAEWTDGAVAPIKCYKSLMKEAPGDSRRLKTSTPAVAQVSINKEQLLQDGYL